MTGAGQVVRSGVYVSVTGAATVVLLSVNLRPAITSVGSVGMQIQAAPGMSPTAYAVLVSAPLWCFAVGGSLAWGLRARWGTNPVVGGALAALALALAVRVAGGPLLLLGGSVLACVAISVLGALLPVIVQAGTPQERGTRMVCLTTALGVGSSAGALVTPVVAAQSSWQAGAACWALLAAAGWVVWRMSADVVNPHDVPRAGTTVGPRALRPRGTVVALTLHFGALSGVTFTLMGWLTGILQERAGLPAGIANLHFAVVMVLGIPVSLAVPILAKRAREQVGHMTAFAVVTALGVVGMLLLPSELPWLWTALQGIGMGSVALALTVITIRCGGDRDIGAGLSSVVQGVGYAIAAAVALGVGLVHSATRSWQWALVALLAVVTAQLVSGFAAGRATTVTADR
ncbi:MFS transporter [Actinomycetes bacterium KLBMP 9759]